MTATHAFGTMFSWNGHTVASLKTINGIEVNADTADVTVHKLDGDNYKEYLAGLLDAGDVVLEGFFDATDTDGQYAMLTDANARATRAGVITFPPSLGAAWNFNGLITSIKIGDAPVDDAIPFNATIKVTGKPTLTVTASTGLSTFTISNATLIPTASGTVYDYIATVATEIGSVTVTPTAATGTITVNGNVVISGEASSAIALGADGTITTITIVVAETNKTPKTYTIQVARA